MKQLTLSSYGEIAHNLHRTLRKEKPRSSLLFIHSRCSPADIPPPLLRMPRNKHTGQGGGSLERRGVVEIATALTKDQNDIPGTIKYFCANHVVKMISIHNKGALS